MKTPELGPAARLPRQPDPLVGRGAELEALRVFSRRPCGLLVVTGAPGAGKTSLLLALAAEAGACAYFPSHTSEPLAVLQSLAAALGVFPPPWALPGQVACALRARLRERAAHTASHRFLEASPVASRASLIVVDEPDEASLVLLRDLAEEACVLVALAEAVEADAVVTLGPIDDVASLVPPGLDADEVRRASDGNPLYLRLLGDCPEKAFLPLPCGIDALMARLVEDEDAELLALLAAARESLPPGVVQSLLGRVPIPSPLAAHGCLAHPALAAWLARHRPEDLERARRALASFCARQDHPYAFRHAPAHLRECGDHRTLYDLATSAQWRHAVRAALPEDLSRPLEAARTALSSAGDDPDILTRLLFAHLEAVEDMRRETPLDALRAGQASRALRLAACSTAPLAWHLILASEILDQGHTEQARDILRRAVTAAQGATTREAVLWLLPPLAPLDPVAAMRVVLALPGFGVNNALARLAPVLHDAAGLGDVLSLIEDVDARREAALVVARVLAQRGHAAEAVDLLQDGPLGLEARAVAEELAEHGAVDAARRVASRLSHPEVRDQALLAVARHDPKAADEIRDRVVRARALALHHDAAALEELLAAARGGGSGSEDCVERAVVLTALGAIRLNGGDAAAGETLAAARAAVDEVDDARRRASLLLDLAKAIGVEHGRGLLLEAARTVADLDAWDARPILNGVIDAQVQAGLHDDARAVNEMLDRPELRIAEQKIALDLARRGRFGEARALLWQVARIQHEAGDVEGAHRTLERAVRMAEQEPTEVARSTALIQTAGAMRACGLPGRCREILDARVREVRTLPQRYASLATALPLELARSGMVEDALEMSEALSDGRMLVDVLSTLEDTALARTLLAGTLVPLRPPPWDLPLDEPPQPGPEERAPAEGWFEAATREVESAHAADRAKLLEPLVMALVDAGETSRALAAVDLLAEEDDTFPGDADLLPAGKGLGETLEQFQAAIEAFGGWRAARATRERLLVGMAIRLARRGDFEQARDIMPHTSEELEWTIARTQAVRGDFEGAVRTVWRGLAGHRRESALAAIAGICVRQGRPGTGVCLLTGTLVECPDLLKLVLMQLVGCNDRDHLVQLLPRAGCTREEVAGAIEALTEFGALRLGTTKNKDMDPSTSKNLFQDLTEEPF